MNWIRVEDRLPSKYGYYLTYDVSHKFVSKQQGCKILRYYPKEKRFWWFDIEYDVNVTHWMPLPDPPAIMVDKE